ncbi:MAG: hypothetical protein HQM02_00980 [Magnetococcales bacterium]|nr:hypothetical protein [Magnetococcales bacterium]
MPAITKQLIGPEQLSTVTGKSFTLKSVAGSKDYLLTPIASKGGGGVLHPILLTNPAVEGLAPAGTAGAKTAGAKTAVAGKGAAAKVAATKGMLPTLVEIEGSGKILGTGKSLTLGGLEINGTLQAGQGGNTILLQGGQATLTQGAIKAKAGAVAAKGTVAGTGGAIAKPVAATVAGTAAKGAVKGTAVAGTIWNGGGLSLGLGIGLGAWGPVLLVGVLTLAGIGAYQYMQQKKSGGGLVEAAD